MGNHHSAFCHLLLLIGRIAFALIFVIAGLDKLLNYQDTLNAMIDQNIPYTEILLIASIVVELGSGLLIILGLWTRLGAFLLIVFMIPVTYYFHDFWTVVPEEAVNQTHHFLKNLSMVGGALYILVTGAGRFSIDGMLKKKK